MNNFEGAAVDPYWYCKILSSGVFFMGQVQFQIKRWKMPGYYRNIQG